MAQREFPGPRGEMCGKRGRGFPKKKLGTPQRLKNKVRIPESNITGVCPIVEEKEYSPRVEDIFDVENGA